MKTLMLAAAAVLSLGVGSAYAESGDGTILAHMRTVRLAERRPRRS
jgi:hypothetical protein